MILYFCGKYQLEEKETKQAKKERKTEVAQGKKTARGRGIVLVSIIIDLSYLVFKRVQFI